MTDMQDARAMDVSRSYNCGLDRTETTLGLLLQQTHRID